MVPAPRLPEHGRFTGPSHSGLPASAVTSARVTPTWGDTAGTRWAPSKATEEWGSASLALHAALPPTRLRFWSLEGPRPWTCLKTRRQLFCHLVPRGVPRVPHSSHSPSAVDTKTAASTPLWSRALGTFPQSNQLDIFREDECCQNSLGANEKEMNYRGRSLPMGKEAQETTSHRRRGTTRVTGGQTYIFSSPTFIEV